MKTRVLMIGLLTISSAAAQPQDRPDRPAQEAVIKRLESEVSQLRKEVREAQDELRRTEQMLRELKETIAPRPVAAPVYSSAVRIAISELGDVEQQLISGETDGVEERLVRAHAALEGSDAAPPIEAAIEALLNGDLGDARGYLVQAIRAAEQAY